MQNRIKQLEIEKHEDEKEIYKLQFVQHKDEGMDEMD
jgi:hypothetical protein